MSIGPRANDKICSRHDTTNQALHATNQPQNPGNPGPINMGTQRQTRTNLIVVSTVIRNRTSRYTPVASCARRDVREKNWMALFLTPSRSCYGERRSMKVDIRQKTGRNKHEREESKETGESKQENDGDGSVQQHASIRLKPSKMPDGLFCAEISLQDHLLQSLQGLLPRQLCHVPYDICRGHAGQSRSI